MDVNTQILAFASWVDPQLLLSVIGNSETAIIYGFLGVAVTQTFFLGSFSIWGFLLILFAILARMTRGQSARGWLWAYWVVTSLSIVGIALNTLYHEPLEALIVLLPHLIQMALSLVILRTGSVRDRAEPHAETDANVGNTPRKYGLTTALALCLPLVLVWLWMHFGPYTLQSYATTASEEFWFWVQLSEYTNLAAFSLISVVFTVFVSTRPPGRQRPDLIPVARAVWVSGVVMVGLSIMFRLIPGVQYYWNFEHDFLAPCAGLLSLVIVSLSPGISPFVQFRDGKLLTVFARKGSMTHE